MSDSLKNWTPDQQHEEILKRYCRQTRKSPHKFPEASKLCASYWKKKKRNRLNDESGWYLILIIILLIVGIGLIRSLISRS